MTHSDPPEDEPPGESPGPDAPRTGSDTFIQQVYDELAAGIHLMRLTQGGHSASSRVVFVR